MKRRCAALAAALLLALFPAGCADTRSLVAEKQYTYSGEAFSFLDPDPFTITIHGDGAFSYYESLLSSYIGHGEWSVSGRVLTLTEETGGGPARVNHFTVDGDDLLFREKGSSNFTYVKVADGERFSGAPIPEEDGRAI